jgi:hypothetical protein
VELTFLSRLVPSAREGARRGSERNRGNVGEVQGRQGRSGLRNGRAAKGNGRYENEGNGSNDRIRRGVTGPHRTVVLPGDTLRIAIALVLLKIARLAVVYWAIGRVAACERISGGNGFRQGGDTRQKQRQKGRDGCEFAYRIPQFRLVSPIKDTREA